MTREKLTKEERWTGKPGLPERDVLARSAAEYAQVIDALTAGTCSCGLTVRRWSRSAAQHSVARAAESSLDAAVALLVRIDRRGGCGLDVHGWIETFLANQLAAPDESQSPGGRCVQCWCDECQCKPAAPTSYDLALREWQGGAPGAARPGKPAAPTYATAAQSTSELMARVHAAPARTEASNTRECVEKAMLAWTDGQPEISINDVYDALAQFTTRTEAEQAVLSAWADVEEEALRLGAETPGSPFRSACRSELARRGLK